MIRAQKLLPFGDPFQDVGMAIVALLLVLLMLGSAIGFAMIYYGDDMARPSWNERTAPLPRHYW